MKATIYTLNAGTGEVESFKKVLDARGSAATREDLDDAGRAAFSALTGIDCEKPQVIFGRLAADWQGAHSDAKVAAPVHAAGSKVIYVDTSNGARFAVFDEEKVAAAPAVTEKTEDAAPVDAQP